LELCKGDLLRIVDETLDFEEVLLRIDFRDTAVVSDVMILVRGDFSLLQSVQVIVTL
jgi:hypothetical protein